MQIQKHYGLTGRACSRGIEPVQLHILTVLIFYARICKYLPDLYRVSACHACRAQWCSLPILSVYPSVHCR